MIPSWRGLAAPLVGKQITCTRNPWQCNLAYCHYYQGQQSHSWIKVLIYYSADMPNFHRLVYHTLTKFVLHWHMVMPVGNVLIVTPSN